MSFYRELSRKLTIVENGLTGADELLKSLTMNKTPVIGVTGPPGAGKSSLLNCIIAELSQQPYKIAILAVDPSSPFNQGAVLGDRIRMQAHASNPQVFIRSVASRGALGGLAQKVIEMTDVLRSSGFDFIFIETVGVGQSEVDIAALADTTLVVLVPESGDETQSMKSGILEIADVFVINKADRAGADRIVKTLSPIAASRRIPIFKTVATESIGIPNLVEFIRQRTTESSSKSLWLQAQKAWILIQEKRMADLNFDSLSAELAERHKDPTFNFYQFVEEKTKCS